MPATIEVALGYQSSGSHVTTGSVPDHPARAGRADRTLARSLWRVVLAAARSVAVPDGAERLADLVESVASGRP